MAGRPRHRNGHGRNLWGVRGTGPLLPTVEWFLRCAKGARCG